ncbi:putative glycosyl hydrolase-like family 15 (GHL15) protein [Kineococcus rhizosphaerae]|uniref:Putative glycosyl hydrolase-like family 15 (GHL15) protein n=1 Tax=Kineococcus rhizosphaerae TaxID=559628 RepID=A0A2T0RB92_9ACTN|nr:putative glycosyl hydrolase-like family 15 (GHL15) protein [Kineococcus rhizosphaerae]
MIRRRASLALAAALAVGAGLVPVTAHASAGSAPTLPRVQRLAASVQTGELPAVQRRGVWYAIGDEPTAAEVDAAPRTYGVVVLNPWDGWAAQRIHQLDPSVVVLMYKDLSSTRSYAGAYAQADPAGVRYAEAEQDAPRWFATDTSGARVQWGPYPGHWQMAVWDSGYQQRWAANVTREVLAGSWDGVLADNDFATLGFYSSAVLAGTTSRQETDAKIRAGLDVMVTTVGTALNARGKVLVPNLSEARLYPGRWASHARYGGAMEEAFAHWGTDTSSGFLWDWSGTGWQAQTAQMASPGLSLAVTRASASDRRTSLFGYTSVLVRGDSTSYWTGSTTPAGDYSAPESIPEMAWPVGAAVSGPVQLVSGAWTRTFQGAFAAVNPTQQRVVVPVPAGFVDAQGRTVSSVTLEATSGTLLKRRVR